MTPRIDIEDMTDAQDEAPERIWLDIDTFNGAVGFAHPKSHAKAHWPAYVRADLYDAAQAEIARLTAALADAETRGAERMREAAFAMAVSRAGEWEDAEGDAAVIIAQMIHALPLPPRERDGQEGE